MRRYSVEPRAQKYVEGNGFLSFARKYKKQVMDTRLDAVKTASKKVAHKAGELIGNKMADAVTKSNDHKIVKQELVEKSLFHQKNR